MADFLFRGELAELDPDVAALIRHETARQERCLILIPSESTVPLAVREALMSPFHNLYAEGYPLDETRTLTQADILDYGARLPEYRRLADKRYYKGTEYANIVEALARRRAAELFATDRFPADKLFVNVQPLSGAPANNAIFSGLLNLGDTIMGLDLLQGGHLTHGSPVNRSGKQYKAASYGVDPVTEKLDYDQIRAGALEAHPRIIIAGFTSYPYTPDWHAFRRIPDEVGAYLMADVSHVAGMIAAGAYPSPVSIADVISFTTHKTLGGPRGAVIITHRADIAGKVDRAVFPGEQGGPHVHQLAALAVALRLARTEQFHQLQHQTVKNAAVVAQTLTERGLRIAYGGTDTHMLLLDCKSVVGTDGTPLSGDSAARLLDLAGIVTNRNTIPGDPSALRASGVRIGLPWVTQRGFTETEAAQLGHLIADIVTAALPFSYSGRKRAEPRAKIPFTVLMRVKNAVRDLAASVGIDTQAGAEDYPHFFYYDPAATAANARPLTLKVRGIGHAAAVDFLATALTADVRALTVGASAATEIRDEMGNVLAVGMVERTAADAFLLHVNHGPTAAAWLRALSDGFVVVDARDLYAKVPGPVDVQVIGETNVNGRLNTPAAIAKPYFVGDRAAVGDPLPVFTWTEPAATAALKTTPLHGYHSERGAKLAPFAGYAMPLWYSSVAEEHAAVRTGVGVFDVAHMGAFDVRGAAAAAFLDVLTTNDVTGLAVGDSHYTYLLDVHGQPLDDLMIYRLAVDHFLLVVNAGNNDKVWAWLNAALHDRAALDLATPTRRIGGLAAGVTLRDLRAQSSGADQRVNSALQGPGAKALLQTFLADADRSRVGGLAWAGVTRATLHGAQPVDAVISRTGYTGERIAYEIFVHPDQSAGLFRALVSAGATPCGLAARDSLRTEAGLPLYGHELAGELKLNPADAGFGAYVKLWKPFFVGKAAFIAHEQTRDAEIVRFRLEQRGVRPPHPGDPVLDRKGKVIGTVTSCSIDRDGYQLGQAYLKAAFASEGTPIAVYCGAERAKAANPAALSVGDKITLPEPALVLSRFPSAKKG